jgi:hypothetical protein
MKRKWLAIGIILLFVGVTIAPTINFNTVKASQGDLVEVTTQACGINGYGNTTVKLTREQYQNLEEYLVEFRARLNQTSTREEAVPIFKDAVVELDKYGLLPKGMSVQRAQRLVIGSQNTVSSHLKEKPPLHNRINDSNNSNYLCLVCSHTDGLTSVGPVIRLSCNLRYFLFDLGYAADWCNSIYDNGHILLSYILSYFFAGILLLVAYPSDFGILPATLNPLKLFYTVMLGGYVFNPYLYESQYVPSDGWVATFGLNGIKIFQEPLWGHLPLLPLNSEFIPQGLYYPGIFGFTGIQIFLGENNMFLLGSALWVEISSEHPSN